VNSVDTLARNMTYYYCTETIKAQCVAADLSARARSYLGALCVYQPSQVPPECRASAAAQQERAAVAYSRARDWQTAHESIVEEPAA
jgi:hypothetical protein